MIDVSEIKAGKLSQLGVGHVYCLGNRSEPFVGGMINENPVIVILSDAAGFELAQASYWERPLGWIFSDVRFEVDEQSASVLKFGPNAPLGTLVLNAGGIWLAGQDNGREYPVCLKEADHDVQRDALMFAGWRIVRGPPNQPQVLFSRSAPAE